MQVTNTTQRGEGAVARISANTSWIYPYLPGEPPNIVLREFAGCVPSNITIADVCCAQVNGTFVRGVENRQSLTSDQLIALLDEKYPGQNHSRYATSDNQTTWATGDPMPTGNNTTGNDVIDWCQMAYNPLSDTPLNGTGYQSGPTTGALPESMEAWMRCFNESIPAGAVEAGQAAYVCQTKDVLTGGQVEGFNRYQEPLPTGAGDRGNKVAAWLAGIGLLAGLFVSSV